MICKTERPLAAGFAFTNFLFVRIRKASWKPALRLNLPIAAALFYKCARLATKSYLHVLLVVAAYL